MVKTQSVANGSGALARADSIAATQQIWHYLSITNLEGNNHAPTHRAQITPRSSSCHLYHKKFSFFKTDAGSYAEHDQFIGVSVPVLRKLAKEFGMLPLEDIQTLLASPVNEERLLALFILVTRYQKGNQETKEQLFAFYLANIRAVNNWNLVDSSAHLIIGAHLHGKDKSLLAQLAGSENMWERRIAIVATWYFIRQNDYIWTYKIAKQLLNDEEDLIHKAVGWMLREAGERNQFLLSNFLELYAHRMPRTMLRYAIEKFPEDERKAFLAIKQERRS